MSVQFVGVDFLIFINSEIIKMSHISSTVKIRNARKGLSMNLVLKSIYRGSIKNLPRQHSRMVRFCTGANCAPKALMLIWLFSHTSMSNTVSSATSVNAATQRKMTSPPILSRVTELIKFHKLDSGASFASWKLGK